MKKIYALLALIFIARTSVSMNADTVVAREVCIPTLALAATEYLQTGDPQYLNDFTELLYHGVDIFSTRRAVRDIAEQLTDKHPTEVDKISKRLIKIAYVLDAYIHRSINE